MILQLETSILHSTHRQISFPEPITFSKMYVWNHNYLRTHVREGSGIVHSIVFRIRQLVVLGSR